MQTLRLSRDSRGIESYRSTNGRNQQILPRSPNTNNNNPSHGAANPNLGRHRASISVKTNGHLASEQPTPRIRNQGLYQARLAKQSDSASSSLNGSTHGYKPKSKINGDGTAIKVPMPAYHDRSQDRMRRTTERRNLRLLIDTNDTYFPGLKRLKFRGKELNTLSNEVFNLRELEILDLSPEREACLYYKLPVVPASISKLVNLRVLILDTNELLNLPPEIGCLAQLEHLTISNNCLTTLPNEITTLRHLTTLHAANNQFTKFPPQIVELDALTFLDLSANKIETIPKSIKKLQKLEILIMFANLLHSLPDEICDLKELRMLWLGDNLLRILPRHFGTLCFLDWDWHYTSTTLDGNPLEHPPLEVCKRGPKAIDQYLKENWSKIERGLPVYTPNPYSSRYDSHSNGTDDTSSRSNYGNTLDVDVKLVRDMRRGSIPIPSPVPDGLAALDDD